MDNKLITLEEENFYKELFEKIEKDLEKHLEKHSEWSRMVARMGSVDDDLILRSRENLEEKKINIRELLGELRIVNDDYRLISKIENKFKCQIYFQKEGFDYIYFYAIYFNLDVLKFAFKKVCEKKVLSKIEWQSNGKTIIFEKEYCMGDKSLNVKKLIIELEKKAYLQHKDVDINKEIEEYIKKINEECLEGKKKYEKKNYFIFMVAIWIIASIIGAMIVFLIGVA